MSHKSNPTDTPDVIHVATDVSEPTEAPVEKQSIAKRGVAFVKTHKKPALAVAALLGLVGVAAVAGRKTASLPEFDATLELNPAPETDEEPVLDAETTVA